MMEWLNVIVGAVCGIVGALGGGTLLHFRQTRKQKEIDNELKEAEEWESLYREKKEECASKDSKIDELRRDINNLREGKLTLVEENARGTQVLQADIFNLRLKLAEADFYRCEIHGCKARIPEREETIPIYAGGYEE